MILEGIWIPLHMKENSGLEVAVMSSATDERLINAWNKEAHFAGPYFSRVSFQNSSLGRAKNAGEIAGAGLDVLPEEPPAKDNSLLGRDDIVLTPHTGFYSEEALLDLQVTVATDVATILSGENPKYPVKIN